MEELNVLEDLVVAEGFCWKVR